MADEEETPETPETPATEASVEAKQAEESAPTPKAGQDPLNTEFLYYSSVLRILGPLVTQEADRKFIIPWIRKLFRPEYHSSKLKEKRNRYLAYLCCSVLLDEAVGVFKDFPPDGALINCSELPSPPVHTVEWELDTYWQDAVFGLPDDFQMLECSVHNSEAECANDHALDKILDHEFQFYLYLAKPYAYLIKNGSDRTRAGAWLQLLCSINGSTTCSSMKAIRNDYMMSLLAYLQDLRVVGPFAELPSWKKLPPLAEAAKAAAENNPITDPTGGEANEFLINQPFPDDGAFCYIALTGDMVVKHLNPD